MAHKPTLFHVPGTGEGGGRGAMLVGYMRVSTADQNLGLRCDALVAAGVSPNRIYEDVCSGRVTDRPGRARALDVARDGDALVIRKLDRIGRSLPHVVGPVGDLQKGGGGLKVLTGDVDTTTMPEQLARFFLLDDADRAFVGEHRGDHDRLCVAVQLGSLRWLGTLPEDVSQVPASVARFADNQLAITGTAGLMRTYVASAGRWRHGPRIRDRYGYHQFTDFGVAFQLNRFLCTRSAGPAPIVPRSCSTAQRRCAVVVFGYSAPANVVNRCPSSPAMKRCFIVCRRESTRLIHSCLDNADRIESRSLRHRLTIESRCPIAKMVWIDQSVFRSGNHVCRAVCLLTGIKR